MKALEADLGFKLFNRERQRLVITAAGRDYLAVIRDAFDRIALGTARLTQRQASGVLTVSTSPDFAGKWLVHRLGRFAELHPEINLRVSATMHHVDFAREDVDLAVRHGTGDASWKGLHGVRLSTEELFPVCSPQLLPARKKPYPAARASQLPLLHLDDHSGWTRWLEAAKVRLGRPIEGLVLNRASMVLDAAINVQGIGLARSMLAAWDLINKRLVAPFDVRLPLSSAYWIVTPQATAEQPKIVTFRRWLLSEAAADDALISARVRNR